MGQLGVIYIYIYIYINPTIYIYGCMYKCINNKTTLHNKFGFFIFCLDALNTW
jgi:hypothetical protein